MPVRQPRYSREEFARRGDALYGQLRSEVERENTGRFLCIDIESGDYEVADDELSACNRLWRRHPDAQPWLVRVGEEYVHRIGRRG